MKPFGIQSDTHHHNWSQFSTALESGVNSRLQNTLNETMRLAEEVYNKGGDTIYHCGDLFHVRGSIAPSVLNPTLDLYNKIVNEMGLKVRILAGNHDLESRESYRLSSAVTALESVGCEIVNSPTLFEQDKVAMIPWHQSVQALRDAIFKVKSQIEEVEPNVNKWTLMIHAPVDGVIAGLPDHGLTNEELADFGFKRVFSGHYHNHKDFGNGVYSVGATTHQTWSDVNSKAGFLLVNKDDEVQWFKSHAPEFVEITDTMDEFEIKAVVDGAYVRAKLNTDKKATVEKVRAFLNEAGAIGVTILTTKVATEVSRSASTVKAGASIDESVSEFVGKLDDVDASNRPALLALCGDILAEARMETGE